MNDNFTIATAICTPNQHTTDVALLTLYATSRGFPDERKLLMVDYAHPSVTLYARRYGWEIYDLGDGPEVIRPRLRELHKWAIDECKTPWLLFIEQDCQVLPGTRQAFKDAVAKIREEDRIGVLMSSFYRLGRRPGDMELAKRFPQYREFEGELGQRLPKVQEKIRGCPTFNGTAWRMSALRQLDFSKLPSYHNLDVLCWDGFKTMGLRCGRLMDAEVLHWHSGSYLAALQKWPGRVRSHPPGGLPQSSAKVHRYLGPLIVGPPKKKLDREGGG